MKPHILIVIDSLVCGGAEKSLVSLLGLLDYERMDVDLLTFFKGGMFESLVPPQINRISHNLLDFGLATKLRQLRYSAWLRLPHKRHTAEMRWICIRNSILPLEREYDVAIAYQQGFPTFFVASRVNANCKLAWVNADVFEAGYDMKWCSKFYDQFNGIVPVSERLADLLRKRCPQWSDRYTTVYDILNPATIRQMATEPIVEAEQMSRQTSIVTVGRLSKPKNYPLAVETAKILKERNINFKWWFVGDGGQRSTIETLINDYGLQNQVILVGLRENPYPYMARADVYVQTSSFEGFGLTIAEAKILGRPVVSTDFEVIQDQLRDGENGLIAEMRPISLADAIERLLNDEPLRRRLMNAAASEQNTTSITEVEKVYRLVGL